MDEPRKQPPPPSPAKAGFGGQSPPEDRGGGPPPNLPTSTAQPPQVRQQPQPYNLEEKRTYLARGEVRTMEKDMARVREEEARKEQQRIAQLKTRREAENEQESVAKIRAAAMQTKEKEEERRQEELKKIQNSILPPGEERRIRDLPHPPSQGKRVFVRLIIVIFFAFIALNVALFASWFFFFRDQAASFQFPQIPFLSQFFPPTGGPLPSPPSPEPLSPPPPSLTPVPAPLPQPQVPTNLISSTINPSHLTTLQFNEQSDFSLLLSQVLKQEQRPGFSQLLFRQKPDNTFVETGEEFFKLFGISPPEDVIPSFSGNSFFFLYSYERGNRFGMIVETPSPEITKLALGDWESQMETNLSPLIPFWATKDTAYTKAFRSNTHEGVEIRFQTFSLKDYGIVYALVNNYVIFASSFEATKAAIEALQSAPLSTSSDLFKPPPVLSLQQKLGQVLMIGLEGTEITPELEDFMKRLQPGGVLLLSKNIQSSKQLRQLTQDLQEISLEYSSLPLFIAVDQEGGAISRIEFGSEKTAQSTIQDPEHAYQVGQKRAEELRFLGVNLNLSPVLDSTKSTDFLFTRTFQAGRLEAGDLAKALLAGQKDAGILSTLKHFPGYGNISFNPEQKLATVQEFPDISPFVFALSAKPEFLLLSNVIYTNLDPDQPFAFSSKGITLVRSNMNFEGLILSDDLNQPSLLNNYAFETIVEAPLKAGTNMIMFSEQPYAQKAYVALTQLVEQDLSLKKKVEDSASRILEFKKQFFFDQNSIVWNKNYWKN